MAASKWATEKAEEMFDWFPAAEREKIAAALDAARQEGARGMRERAAKVAERDAPALEEIAARKGRMPEWEFAADWAKIHRKTAAAIRALPAEDEA